MIAMRIVTALLLLGGSAFATDRPNVIMVMADDLGWRDTGYNGHPFVQTPHLDAMTANGIRFDRWYAASAVCSPTRASCLTGRHPNRFGITGANKGHLPHGELSITEMLKPLGYATGFFGKWHLGTLTKTVRDSNRGGPENTSDYSPPWEHGFDISFSTEAKVPAYDPMITPKGWGNGLVDGEPFGTYYWDGPEQRATENLEGDDSRIIMDRAILFIQNASKNDQPFFAAIWFHAPHLPIVAGPEHRALYSNLDEEGQHYFGCITALDEQIGRLRDELRKLGVADNTMLWFCSDNGPEGNRKRPNNGSSGDFRGRKRALYEGGVRVPGLLEWPAQVNSARVTNVACVTSDYLPTIRDAVGLDSMPSRNLDGISLLPLIEGHMKKRPEPIAFSFQNRRAYSDTRYKIHADGKEIELYDLKNDPSETTDLAQQHPRILKKLSHALLEWEASTRD